MRESWGEGEEEEEEEEEEEAALEVGGVAMPPLLARCIRCV